MNAIPLALAVSLLGQGADKIKESLNKLGERTYRYVVAGQDIGTIKLKTAVEKSGDREVAVFEDTMQVEFGGKKRDLVLKQTSNLDPLLTPITLESKGSEEEFNYSAKLRDGRLQATLGGVEKQIDVGASATTMTSIWRLVCVVEQKKGAEYAFDWIKGQRLVLKKGQRVTCGGPEKVTVDGKERDAVRWTHTTDEGVTTDLWVSTEGYLLRIINDQQTIELIEK